MPFRHKLQASRFEFKYVIDEELAIRVRHFLSSNVELDEHAQLSADNAYPVHSLYLDSPDLSLFKQTAHGIKNRFKLRIRFYDGNPEGPAFLEIKKRVTDVIRKERAAVRREAVEYLLKGGRPDDSYLVETRDMNEAGSALQNFCRLYESIGAQPRVYVCYVREAYTSPDSDRVRVTFDRQLTGTQFGSEALLVPPAQGAEPKVGGVILELKFTDRFPPWLQELVTTFNLQRRSVPKYNMCIHSLDMQPWNWPE
ncbi:MAG: polyphosphate polymerase domain-containing protein [Candidatus Nealsonbacteria bacterium]|nr:polyphosphate polymerase domain-containing protein [Candidatus Nealsonbacteria bacterium]